MHGEHAVECGCDLESRSPGLNPSSAPRELRDLGNHPVAPGFLLGRTDSPLELLCAYSRGVKGTSKKPLPSLTKVTWERHLTSTPLFPLVTRSLYQQRPSHALLGAKPGETWLCVWSHRLNTQGSSHPVGRRGPTPVFPAHRPPHSRGGSVASEPVPHSR